MPSRTIESRYAVADAKRSAILNTKRACARLSLPWLLLPDGHENGNSLPHNYQSLASRGVTITRGKYLLQIYDPTRPWIKQEVHPSILYAPNKSQADIAAIAKMREILFLQDMTVMAIAQSAVPEDDRSLPSSFYSSKGAALLNTIALGDSLQFIKDDYTITVFRFDQYITKRDGDGRVLYHIIKERKDPLTLTDDQFAKSGYSRDDMNDKSPEDREADLFTLVEWQNDTKKWRICQEMNKNEIVESDEEVSPFVSVPYELAPGEDYGRGLVEINFGDTASMDNLCERRLDAAAMCSKFHPVIDSGSNLTPSDLAKKSGEVLVGGNVEGGVVRDVAWLKVDKTADFQVLNVTIEAIRRDLGPAYLIDSEMVRHSERTTAFEIQSVSLKELQGVAGGTYAALSDKDVIPTYRRIVSLLKAQKLYPVAPKGMDKYINVQTLTGMSALAHQAQATAMLSLADLAAKLGPEAMARIDPHVLLETYARFLPMHEPGLVKSRAQVDAEMDEQIMRQAQLKAIDVAGNIAEQQAVERTG